MRRIAIITGASRLDGIGKTICCELAEKGFDIFFTYWRKYDSQMPWKTLENEPDLIEIEIKKTGVRCEKLELDLSLEKSYDILLNEVEAKLGKPTVLVNNATYSTQTDIKTITESELDKHYAVNMKATTMLTVEFIKRFDGKKNGRIINLTSGQSLSAMSSEIAYAITKGAIETLTTTLAREAALKGVTINAVNPGLTDSGWLSESEKTKWRKYFPMGRLGEPKDVARLIAFLSSPEAEWITGQIIHSEGGFNRENYDL